MADNLGLLQGLMQQRAGERTYLAPEHVNQLFGQLLLKLYLQRWLKSEQGLGLGMQPPENYPKTMQPPFENRPGQELYRNPVIPGVRPWNDIPTQEGDVAGHET